MKIIEDDVNLALNIESPYDEAKLAKLEQFGLNQSNLEPLMSGVVKIVLGVSSVALGSESQEGIDSIIKLMLKYDPNESMIKKLSDIFDQLKEVADRNPALKDLIDTKIMEFVTENRELIKPIINTLLNKYFKSYSLELFKANVDLDSIFDVTKENFKIDQLQHIFSLLNHGGVGNYASLLKVATSSGIMGLLAGGARSYVGNWWSTSPARIATDLATKLNGLPKLTKGPVQDIDWESMKRIELIGGRGDQTLREFNKRLDMAYFGGLTLGSAVSPLQFACHRVAGVGFDSAVLNINIFASELRDCSFAQAKISGDLRGGKMSGCNLNKAKLENLAVTGVVLEEINFSDVADIKNAKFTLCTFRNCSFDAKALSKMGDLEGCTFENCTFKGDCKQYHAFKANEVVAAATTELPVEEHGKKSATLKRRIAEPTHEVGGVSEGERAGAGGPLRRRSSSRLKREASERKIIN